MFTGFSVTKPQACDWLLPHQNNVLLRKLAPTWTELWNLLCLGGILLNTGQNNISKGTGQGRVSWRGVWGAIEKTERLVHRKQNPQPSRISLMSRAGPATAMHSSAVPLPKWASPCFAITRCLCLGRVWGAWWGRFHWPPSTPELVRVLVLATVHFNVGIFILATAFYWAIIMILMMTLKKSDFHWTTVEKSEHWWWKYRLSSCLWEALAEECLYLGLGIQFLHP